jgi:hypothetical protein
MEHHAMKNRLCDLNDHLFAQIERLADEDNTPEKIEQEHKRAYAMVAVADQIIRAAATQIRAAELVTDFDGSDPRPYLSTMRNGPVESPASRSLTVVAGRK